MPSRDSKGDLNLGDGRPQIRPQSLAGCGTRQEKEGHRPDPVLIPSFCAFRFMATQADTSEGT